MTIDIAPKLVIDAARLESAIHERGFRSVKDFAVSVGLHRNTVGNYISGKATLPSGLAKILVALDLSPGEVLELRPRMRVVAGLTLSPLIDQLQSALPGAAFVLFGSRARGSAKPYSDYDLGVYARDELCFTVFSQLLNLVGEWNDNTMSVAQLTNLRRAKPEFLRRISPDLIFLAGSHSSWGELLQAAGVQLHE